jgi:hypothetical protein
MTDDYIGQNRREGFSILPNIVISQNEKNCLVIDAPKLPMNKLLLMI